jgi:hypothetical protein
MSAAPRYRLLDTFEQTFRGVRYRHRTSNLGDFIAIQLYEDLYNLRRSAKYKARVDSKEYVINIRNILRGIASRRGDGTFGERVPGVTAVDEPGFSVARGQLATVEIGVEVKILAKAMIKQIDRVMSDLRGQVAHFRRGGSNAIAVGIVGINHATAYTSYEGDRAFPTDGKKYTHPSQEARAAQERLLRDARPHFDEFLLLHFRATNVEPYAFDWVDAQATRADYGAILTRISREYDRRF